MTEKFSPAEAFSAFRPEDVDRLEEIERTREELLRSGNLPEEVLEMLRQMDIKGKSKEVYTSIENQGRERETIAPAEASEEVRIGRETTPIFENDAEGLSWDISTNQFREDGQTMVALSFKRSDGLEIQPGGAPAKGQVRFEDRDRYVPLSEYKDLKKERANYLAAVEHLSSGDAKQKEEAEQYLEDFRGKHPDSEWALRALRHLNGLASKESNDLLGRDPNFAETPHVVETMEKMTRLINRQRERKQGIVILEGDAGTGKNKLVDHFGYLTHRPIFRFTCSAGKDEQDLKYLLEYDTQRGTYRINSTVVEALETPGAILEFDEINTLKPEVAKMLNSLFDHDRALFLGEDKHVVRAADEVVMVGLQNPQHYMGVKPLAETIKSRARIMEVLYPPFEKEKTNSNEPPQYRADEAMILRQYLPEFKGMDQREFQLAWDMVVNKKKDPRAADLVTAERTKQIENIKEIVTIANRVREAYRAYHEGRSDDPIKFVFSLRESVEAAYELADVELTEQEKGRGMTRAKKAVQDVILPKIPMGEERTYLSSLIAEI